MNIAETVDKVFFKKCYLFLFKEVGCSPSIMFDGLLRMFDCIVNRFSINRVQQSVHLITRDVHLIDVVFQCHQLNETLFIEWL